MSETLYTVTTRYPYMIVGQAPIVFSGLTARLAESHKWAANEIGCASCVVTLECPTITTQEAEIDRLERIIAIYEKSFDDMRTEQFWYDEGMSTPAIISEVKDEARRIAERINSLPTD
jgi:hypothetical protein